MFGFTFLFQKSSDLQNCKSMVYVFRYAKELHSIYILCLFFSFPCSSEWVACVRSNFLVLCYLHDVKNILQLHDLATGTHLKTFPLEVGSIVGYSGQKKDSEIFYQFTSFLSPGKMWVFFFPLHIVLFPGDLNSLVQ